MQCSKIGLRMQPKEEATLSIPFTLREQSYSCKAQWNSIGNSYTSNTCNPYLHCGNDPAVANHLAIPFTWERSYSCNHNGIPSTAHPVAPLAIPFTLRKRSHSCKSQWNSVVRKPLLQCGTDPRQIRTNPNISEHTRDRLAPVARQR